MISWLTKKTPESDLLKHEPAVPVGPLSDHLEEQDADWVWVEEFDEKAYEVEVEETGVDPVALDHRRVSAMLSSQFAEPFARHIDALLPREYPDVPQAFMVQLADQYTVRDLNLSDFSVSEGTHIYLLEPKNDASLPLIVSCQVLNPQDLKLQEEEPGSFLAVTIQAQIAQSLIDSGTSKIICTGYSLGGSVAQWLTHEVLFELAQERSGFGSLKSLELCTFQSVGVSRSIEQAAEKNARQAKEKHRDLRLSCVAAVKQSDLVNSVGQHILLGENLGPDVVALALIKLNLSAHQKMNWAYTRGALVSSGLSLFINPTPTNLAYQTAYQASAAWSTDAYNRHVDPCFSEGFGPVLDQEALEVQVLTNETPEDRARMQSEMKSRGALDRSTLGLYSRTVLGTWKIATVPIVSQAVAPVVVAASTARSVLRSVSSVPGTVTNMVAEQAAGAVVPLVQDGVRLYVNANTALSGANVLVDETKKRMVPKE